MNAFALLIISLSLCARASNLGEADAAALPMADFLDVIPGDEEQAVPGSNDDEAVDRWEAMPLQVSEADLARDSDAILREDEAGSNSLARQELHESSEAPHESSDAPHESSEATDEMLKDYEDLQEDLGKQQVLEEDDIKMEQEKNVAGILEIYNVDDFDEKYDDVPFQETV